MQVLCKNKTDDFKIWESGIETSFWWASNVSLTMSLRHEQDWRQSQSGSDEISKVSRHRFAGFWLKVPFVSVHFSGPAIFWTKRCDTLRVRKIWLFQAGQGTAKQPKMPSKEPQCYVQVRSEKKFRSSIV